MEINLKKNDKLRKIVMGILFGILLLIIAMPVKNNVGTEVKDDEASDISVYSSYAEYYEARVKMMLEDSYGKGTMEVMVHLSEKGENSGVYGYSTADSEYRVDGILIVADVNNEQAVADITYAVCALFDLPAHKCAVLLKN